MAENVHFVVGDTGDELRFLLQSLAGAGRAAARALPLVVLGPGPRAWRDGCAAEVVEDTSAARPADDLGRREQPA